MHEQDEICLSGFEVGRICASTFCGFLGHGMFGRRHLHKGTQNKKETCAQTQNKTQKLNYIQVSSN